ncbi:MAG: tRNA pseudouridine synthase A [Alphaproteobacteria bacterium MarineAlpha5_Bin8]|mgnify:FL=1|nr:MAG: tRNA pseudouridine synthase A [Alphaproteobacteria bacterium MarineAlpha5_Bin8]PPR54360.1 MAG: tRNA pseudouridine synthase A [Alphaproteobacteria bacterium MarineAlpha5_Bin6]|tara:strand:+ start:293 stop:1030 length:738 start_codon:yes stop_codon:yes gene_type:complete
MPKYKITIEYDGSNFVGWQRQENGNSIQESIEKAITKITSKKINVFGAGRTDAGVHAKGQVAHFETLNDISVETIRDGLNQYLRNLSIAILDAEKVSDDFHARFSATHRYYQYFLINRRAPLTLNKNYAWAIYKKLKIDKMKIAANYFIGKYDFNSFRSIDCQSSSSIKTISSCEVNHSNEEVIINVAAKSFLHSQVRIIVGTLVEVGKGKIQPDDIKEILESKDRARAGPTAPAHGLYLIKVDY